MGRTAVRPYFGASSDVFSLNRNGIATQRSTAFPSFFAGVNVHYRAASIAACANSGAPLTFITATSAVLPSAFTSTFSQTVPSV